MTVPYSTVFRNLDEGRPEEGEDLEKFNACGCGWPHYLLVPKGNAEGYPMDLFIMVTDSEIDGVRKYCGAYCISGY